MLSPTKAARAPVIRWTGIVTIGAALILLGLVIAPRVMQQASPSEEFVLVPPEGTSFGGAAIDRTPGLAIASDGERIAFVATNQRPGSRPLLWIRPIRSLNAVPLGGTEGAREPFWSPDGAYIGFFADGKLKKVASTGGTATTLAEASLGSGGTWNRDGVIVFAPHTQSGLLRVPDTGGTPTPVTRLSSGEYGHVYPQFLPDGRLLYLGRAAPPRKGIYIASLDSPDVHFILAAREKARYAPSGQLLFMQDGRLLAQAFDLSALQLRAAPIPLVDSVAFISTDGRASYDVSEAGVLVYRPNGLLAASQPVLVDFKGKTIATVGEPGDYQTANVSPDGKTLAVEKHDLRTSGGDLWLIDLDSGSTSRLTFDGMHNNAAVWAPDSKRIVFTGRPDGIRNLHVKTVGEETDEPLLAPGPDRTPSDWSVDGTRILYQEGNLSQRDIWVLEMPERRPVPFLRSMFDEWDARFSPDGKRVAYVSNETGKEEVYVRSYAEAGTKRLLSINGGQAPRWSRNGRELFYVSPDGSIMVIDLSIRGTLEAGSPKVLFATDMRLEPFNRGATAGAWFDVTEHGFFIVPNPLGPQAPAPPITVTTEWTRLLSK